MLNIYKKIWLLGIISLFLNANKGNAADTTMTIYVVPPITDSKILPNASVDSEYISNEISIMASPGEYEPASFVVHANENIPSLEVTATELIGSKSSIPDSNVDIRVVKCWYQAGYYIEDITHKTLTPELLLKNDSLVKVEGEENYLKLMTGNYAWISKQDSGVGEALIPIDSFPVKDSSSLCPVNIPNGTNKQFWITVKVPEGTPDGLYTGKIELRILGELVKELQLTVKVLPIVLLKPYLTYSLYYGGQLHPDWQNGSISSVYKSEEQMRVELQDMFNHGITNPTVGSLSDNQAPRDTTLFGKILRIRNDVGIDGQPLYCLWLQTWQYGADTVTLKNDVTSLLNFVSSYGVSQLYVYVADECHLDNPESRAQIDAVHNAGGKVFDAQFQEYIKQIADALDLAIANLPPDTSIADLYHSFNHQVFSYANPQTGLELPETYRRNYGLLLWQKDYDGAMNFAYQWSFCNIWNDFDNRVFRDHNFTYPTVDGVIPTIQWEGQREGIDDVRYLTTLIELSKQHPSSDVDDWLDQLKNSDLSIMDLDFIRAEMINWILYLTGIATELEDNIIVFSSIVPNPSTSYTVMRYNCEQKKADVKISIYDLSGREVINLRKELQNAGAYKILWNGTNSAGRRVTAGTYFVKFIVGNRTEVKKLILLK